MRLRAPNFNMPPWVGKVLTGLLLVMLSPMIAGVLALLGVLWIKRKAIGPQKDWSRWFAWHPVTVRKERGATETRWLEMVERRSHGFMHDIYKRPAGGTWEPVSW